MRESGFSFVFQAGPNRLELAEEVLAVLRAGGCTAGDAREVLALVACRIAEKEARAAL